MTASTTTAIDGLDWAGAPSELQNRGPAFRARTALIARVMRNLAPTCLLDIGCGRGYVTAVAATRAHRVIATDVSPGAVDATRVALASHPGAEVCAADPLAGNWGPLANNPPSPDVILLSEVLEHIEDDAAALRALHTLAARHDSRIVLTVPANPALWTEWDELAGHHRRYTRVELLSKLDAAGFDVRAIKSWGFPVTGWLANKGSKMRAARVSDPRVRSEIPRAMSVLLPVADFGFRILGWIEASLFSNVDRGSGYVVLARPR
jgi:2-polyprenyl-3-methyl-5-hydroxy-6-metoxy-1,4-benzoquinol methylase